MAGEIALCELMKDAYTRTEDLQACAAAVLFKPVKDGFGDDNSQLTGERWHGSYLQLLRMKTPYDSVNAVLPGLFLGC